MSDDARLEVLLEARLDKLQDGLNKANQNIGNWAHKTQQHIDETNGKWDKLFGHSDPGKALENVFNDTRFKLLDSGIARVGLVGSALEALGPAGLVAAAGIGLVGAAFAEAHSAAEFAADIKKAADNAHVSTDVLQEFRQALRLAGGDEKAADGALVELSSHLGQAEAGVKKALTPFKELFGNTFTAQSAKQLGGTAQALDAITKALAKLPSEQQDAALDQFGLSGLKPLLETGPAKMAALRDEAHKLGLVMDADLVKRGAAANEQFETLSKVIDVQLKSAFVDLGPILVGLLSQMAKFAQFAAGIADSFRSIQNKSSGGLEHAREQFAKRANSTLDGLVPGLKSHDEERAADALREQIKREFDPANQPKKTPAQASLHDQTKVPAVRDDTAQRIDEVAADLATAEKGRLQAEQALTANIEDRAKLERGIIDAELAASIARLEKQRAAIDADKGISAAKKKELNSALDTVEWTDRAAAAAKIEAVDREEIRKTFDSQFEHNSAIAGYLDTVAQISGEMADTAEARRKVGLATLDADQRLARIAQKEALDRAVQDKSKTPFEAADELRAGDAARQSQRVLFLFQNAGPVDHYLHSIQDLNTEIQNAGVHAAQSLASGLADAIVNAKSLGEVGRSVFRQLIQDVLQAVIEKNITSKVAAFVAAIPGFAGGTDFAPGGMALVGENGPELVNLPRGSQVTTNANLQALQNMSIGSRPGVTVLQPVSFDLRGAVMTEDLLRQMQSIGVQSAVAATSAARKLAVSDLGKQARRRL